MEHKGSLPHSQVHATCTHFKPYKRSIPLLEQPFNIILPFTPTSSRGSRSIRLPCKNPVCNSHHPQTYYMLRPSYSSKLDNMDDIGWGVWQWNFKIKINL